MEVQRQASEEKQINLQKLWKSFQKIRGRILFIGLLAYVVVYLLMIYRSWLEAWFETDASNQNILSWNAWTLVWIFGIIIPSILVALALGYLIFHRIKNKPGSRTGLNLAGIAILMVTLPIGTMILFTGIYYNRFKNQIQDLAPDYEKLQQELHMMYARGKNDSQIRQSLEELEEIFPPDSQNTVTNANHWDKIPKKIRQNIDFLAFLELDPISIDELKEDSLAFAWNPYIEILDKSSLHDFILINSDAIQTDLEIPLKDQEAFKFGELQTESATIGEPLYEPESIGKHHLAFIIGIHKTTTQSLIAGILLDPHQARFRDLVMDEAGNVHLIAMEMNSILTDAPLLVISITIPIILLAAALGFLMTRGISGPVKALIEGTKQLARGRSDYRIPKASDSDLGQLIDAFNEMSEELERTRFQLYQAEKLSAWREVAKRLAHEVKNPLTPIKLSAERLFRQYYNKNPNFEKILVSSVETMTGEVERLRQLVNEFSEFARNPTLRPEKTNIIILMQECIEMFKTSNPDWDFALETHKGESEFILEIDPSQVKQVFINLIKNAIEATSESGTHKINIFTKQFDIKNNPLFRIAIKDFGKGMDEQQQRQLFTPYFTTKEEGTGLGLVIVKNIIEEHSGRITCESKKDYGTTFIIDLPFFFTKKINEMLT